MNIGVNSANDTTIDSNTTNQVVISTPVFHLFLGICLSVIICCACTLFCCCFAICYYYSPSKTNKNNINPKSELKFKQVQSSSQISIQNNASLDSYEIESTPTKSNIDSEKRKLKKTNKNHYNRSQSVPINLQSPKSAEGSQLDNYINKQRRITSGGPDIHPKNINSNHKRFNSEELYDIKSPEPEKTPFGTPNDDAKCDHSAVDSESTLTLKTVGNTQKSVALVLANPNTKNGEMNVVLEVYENDNEGHRKSTINTLDSEGYKITEKEKLNQLKYEGRYSKYKQYEINENHIPDIKEESDLDITCEDDCKTIHHDTVKKHKKKTKKHRKRKKYHEKHKHRGRPYASPNKISGTEDNDDDVLMDIDNNQNPQSPFRKQIGNCHYHTQPNLKYVPKQKALQPPFIVDDKNKNCTVHR